MKKIIECVPNFSEGRNQNTINAIAEAIRNTEGCSLLDVDPGVSTNRTVYTFVGNENAVVQGAFNAAKVAKELIDMRTQKGEHPRMGAMDVCPFVPVSNATMEDCIECSKQFAKKASEELGLSFYLYEESSNKDYRKRLPDIRKGEYEAMEDKVKLEGWEPDYWSGEFDPKWGVTATGARFFLIAYNINVLAPYNQAHRIALNLREAGRGDGKAGRLKETKGMGWHVDEYNMAQITMNLNNYKVTPPHIAFEEAKKDATELNIALSGSELIGLIPLEAMLMAADYYIKKEGLFIIDEDRKIKLVIDRLGLNSISQFIPEKRIIEYIIREERNEPLASLSLRGFMEEVAARTMAPGGGSVSAAIAGLGTGLGAMVTWLTYGVRKYENVQEEMKKAIPNLVNSTQDLIPKVDEDTDAFNDYIDSLRMPKNTEEEIALRKEAMENGMKKAIMSPLSVMRIGDGAWEQMKIAAVSGNFASKSDIQVGTRALELGIWGSYQNVMINMANVSDETWKDDIKSEADKLLKNSVENCGEILEILEGREA